MDGEDLKLKHAELGFDAGGWLKIRKLNGEEISLHFLGRGLKGTRLGFCG